MNRTPTTSDHGNAGVKPHCETKLAPKWAILLNDGLYPMPRQKLESRTILDQAGCGDNLVLVRDHNSQNDVIFGDDDLADLSEGNVFRTIPRCEAIGQQVPCVEPAKLAFVIEDAWEITLKGTQTAKTLRNLFDLPEDVELLRDMESPNDQPISEGEKVLYADGPVFTLHNLLITVRVNTVGVSFKRRLASGLEIKKAAIAQGVKIEESFVLYKHKPDGGLGPAILDDEKVCLKPCDKFNCVAPDDNS